MSDFTIVAGDTAPSLNGTLTDTLNAPLNLTGATVRFQMRLTGDGRYIVDADAVIVGSAADGLVRYDWEEGDTTLAGNYFSRWQITYTDGTVQHTEPENTITVDPA